MASRPLLPCGWIFRAPQIERDLKRLAPLTSCVRTYSALGPQGRITKFAGPQRLKVLQGIWLGRNRAENRREIEAALRLARQHPDVVEAFIVGNEVLLRGELPAAAIKGYMTEVKRAVRPPRHLCRCLGVLAEIARARFGGRLRHHPHPALLGGRSGRGRGSGRPCAGDQGEASGQVRRQGDLDRGGWLAERGADARRRAALARQPGARVKRRRGGGQAGRLEGQSDRGIRPAVEAAAGRERSAAIGDCSATAPSSRNSVSAQAVSNEPEWRVVAGLGVVRGVSRVSFGLARRPALAAGPRRGCGLWRPQESRSPRVSCSGLPRSACNMEGVEQGDRLRALGLFALARCRAARRRFRHRARRPHRQSCPGARYRQLAWQESQSPWS